MRDQVILARNALKNDIPLFTLVGKDKFALQTLEYYYSLAKKECSNEFIKDLELLIEDFRKLHIPADTRSAFPVISVQSPVSIQCCWQS